MKVRGYAFGVQVVGLLSTLMVMCVGCGESTNREPEPVKNATTPTGDVEPKKEVKTPVVITPEATLQAMLNGLRENRPEIVWRAMPTPFRKELNGVTREFAGKVPREVWKQGFATWTELAAVLRDRKSAIFSLPQLQSLSETERQRLETQWQGGLDLLTLLIQSDLRDPDKLATFDWGAFLENTGGEWMSQLAAVSQSLGEDSLAGLFSGLTPKTLSITDDKAKMAWVTEDSPEPVSTFSMIKVGERWVPAGWVPAWEQIRGWRGQLRQMPDDVFIAQKDRQLQSLKAAQDLIRQLQATKTDAEFAGVLTEQLGETRVEEFAVLLRNFAGRSGTMAKTETAVPPDLPKNTTDANSVRLLIRGANDAAAEDRIFLALESIVLGDVDVQFQRIRDVLRVTVGPVTDFARFQRELSLGKITNVDEATRTLQIEYAP